MTETLKLAPLRVPYDDADAVRKTYLTESGLRHALSALPFCDAYDYVRGTAFGMYDRGDAREAIDRIVSFDALLTRRGGPEGALLDIHAALMQTLVALRILTGDIDGAMTDAAAALTLLSQSPKRKDEPFLSVLAALLHDIAVIHVSRGEFRQAEREIEKSIKIFGRLARLRPERYSSAHMLVMGASTGICQSRQRQAKMLAEYSEDTERYMERLKQGDLEAANSLIDSLGREGETLARMGRHREAVEYYTRAVRHLTQAEPEFGLRHLRLSIGLGESLLNVNTLRDKGVHLLNTMLHKATRLNADAEHRHIVDTLLNARDRKRDILGFWHKIFPR